MNQPAIFLKRPLAVQALRWTGANAGAMERFTTGQARFEPADDAPPKLTIHTLEGDMVAGLGDWVIKGLAGEFYPVREDVFRLSYVQDGDAE